MGDNKISGINLSRRNLFKLAIPCILSGLTASKLFMISSAQAANTTTHGKRILTVYYSRTGNTQTMAGYIHDMVGGDIVRIETIDQYPVDHEETVRQARKELDSGYNPPLKTKISNIEEYDVVFVGSPCWWHTICPPVISFLSEYDFAGKTVVPFMTHKGSGLGRTMSHVKKLCPGAKLEKGLAIWGDEISSSRDEVDNWLRGLEIS